MAIYTQKPLLGVQLNRAHQFARGLQVCLASNEGMGSFINDLSGNGYNASFAGTWGGEGPIINSGTNAVKITNANAISNTIGTLFFLIKRIGNLGDPNASVINIENTANNSPQEMLIYQLDGDMTFWPNYDGDAADYWNFGDTLANLTPLNVWKTIAVTYKDTVSINGYIDGVSVGSQGGNADWPTAAWANSEVISIGCLAGSAQTAYHINSILGAFYYYNRILSPSEISQLHAQPFAMFVDDILWRILYVEAAVGIAPTGALYGPLMGPMGGPI